MCTVSWEWEREARLRVFFNRDERRSRGFARRPKVFLDKSTPYVCPVDPDRGGTWLVGNDHGMIVAVLNDYSVDLSVLEGRDLESRGHLVRNAADCRTMAEVERYVLSVMAESTFPPFTLLCWETKTQQVKQWHWNLECLTESSPEQSVVTSSSWETARVERARRELFLKWVENEGRSLESYHKHVIPDDAESSPCMARELTQTVSITEVVVKDDMLKMHYMPRSPEGAFVGDSHSYLTIK